MRVLAVILGFIGGLLAAPAPALELAGYSVTPHNQSANMRYRRPPEPELGALKTLLSGDAR